MTSKEKTRTTKLPTKLLGEKLVELSKTQAEEKAILLALEMFHPTPLSEYMRLRRR